MLSRSSRRLKAIPFIVASFALTIGGLAQGVAANRQEQSPSATPVALSTIPPELTDYAGDWPTAQGDLQATRNATTTIDSSNVNQLEVAWRVPINQLGMAGSMTANPIVAGDTVYMQDMQSNIYALDRATGAEIWRTDYGVSANGPNGVALGYGMVFATIGANSTVVALDAETGAEIWNHRLAQSPGTGAQMAPIVYDGQLFVSTTPNGATDYYQAGNRGLLYALDPMTGDELWWFDTTDDNAFNAPKQAGGGGLWYPPAFDADGNLYFGTGNPAPIGLTGGAEHCVNASCRPGDNDFTNSMVALDGETGGVLWSVNAKPHDQFDLDFQNTPIVATVDNDGNSETLVIGTGKTGTVIAVDAVSGQIAWWIPVGKHLNDRVEIIPDGESILVYPGPSGSILGPASYADNTVYVNYYDMGAYFTSEGIDASQGGDGYNTATGGVVAIDALTGQIKWETKVDTVLLSGTVIANDIVFAAGLDGQVRGFDTATGEQIYSFQADAGINAPLAVTGDMLLVPAGTAYIPHEGTEPAVTEQVSELIALKLPS